MSDTTLLPPASQPEAPIGVREWQSRLFKLFEARLDDKEGKGRFALLREGMSEGRYGGCPISGSMADCLVILLERLRWDGTGEQFARAMPHFPLAFTFTHLCEVLVRLGYEIEEVPTGTQIYPALGMTPGGQPVVLDQQGGEACHVTDLGNTFSEAPMPHLARLYVIRKAPAPADHVGRGTWLATTIHRFRKPIRRLFFITAFINLMVLITSFAVASIYDSVIPSHSFDTLGAILAGVCLAFLIEMAFRTLKAQLVGHLSGHLEYLVGTEIFSKLMSLPLEKTTGVPIGVQLTRLGQFETVRDLFAGPFAAIVLELPFIVLFVALLFGFGGPIGFVALVLIVIYAVLAIILLPELRHRGHEAVRLRQKRQAILLETASNIRTIRLAGCEHVWSQRLTQIIRDSSLASSRAAAMNRLLSTLSAAAVPLAGGATVVIGAMLVMAQSMTTGALIGCMILIWRVLAPIQQAFMAMTRLSEMRATFQQIDQMMKIPAAPRSEEQGFRRRFSGALSFDKVFYRYPGATEPAISALSAEIKSGEFIAVMGQSGAGKTTLLRLLLHLFQPMSGTICLDGVNTRQVPDGELKATIGYVPCTPALFHGTIAQNLRLVVPDARDADLRRVCGELGILRVIESLPKGMNTLLDHAVQDKLPAGFRQSLAIAQALLREPQVLVLDEPSHALDPAIETHFLRALANRKGRMTIILVTHRQPYAMMADRVLFLNRGQMVALDPPAKIFAMA
jgi:ATP-binding cassette, subfamily C, bacterial LapB